MSEQLTLPDTYDPRFKALMERLRQKYPPELFSLSGIHPDQLNIDLMSKAFFKNRSENSATADVSIDPNANVTGRDCITYNYELPKAALRLNSLYNLWKQLEAEVGKRLADKAIEGDLAGYIYINDSWDLGRPYSYHPGTTIFIREGQNGSIRHLSMSMLFDSYHEFVAVKDDYEEVNLKPFGLLVYEAGKWVNLERILRHISDVALIRFETKKGNVFTVTEDHPCILSDDSEKRAQDVGLGEKIKSYPLGALKKELSNPVEVDIDRAYTIGAMIGDGSVNWKECAFHQNDAMNSSYAPIFSKVYGELHSTQNGRGFKFGDVETARWFIRNIGVHALNKHFPENYLNWTPEAQQALLAGIIDTDGTVNKKSGVIDVRMISLAAIQQIAELATLLGFERVRTSLAHNYQNDEARIAQTQPLYRVSFVIPENCRILILSYKANQHKEVILRKRQKDGRFDTDEVLKKDTVSFKGRYVYDITTSTGKFYTNGIIAHNCFNYSALDVALEGLKMGGRLRIDPPKSLDSFLRQMEQFTVYAANSTLGACGFADLLLVASRYVELIKLTGMDHKVKVFDHDYTFGDGDLEWRRLKTYVKEKLISFIYTLNWEFRGNQSPFTNISVYDRPFLDKLLPAYAVQGKAPNVHVVEMVQSWFLEAFNETLARTPVTFPVVTACFSVTQDEEGGRRLADRAFLIKIAEANKAFGFINIYCGESSTLSSCCRLRSSISDLGYWTVRQALWRPQHINSPTRTCARPCSRMRRKGRN